MKMTEDQWDFLQNHVVKLDSLGKSKNWFIRFRHLQITAIKYLNKVIPRTLYDEVVETRFKTETLEDGKIFIPIVAKILRKIDIDNCVEEGFIIV